MANWHTDLKHKENCLLFETYFFARNVRHLDHTMSEAGGASEFIRQYTLASGGPYCDCGYKKKGRSEH